MPLNPESPSGSFVRMMASQDPGKAYAQLADLARRGDIRHGMVVAELSDSQVHIVGQRANAEDMCRLLLYAAEALKHVPEHQRGPLSKAAAERGEHADFRATPAGPQPQRPAASYPPTVAGQWTSLSDAIFDDATPDEQRREMRRAFYAGASAFLRLMMGETDPGLEPSDNDLGRMAGCSAELDAFGDALQAGCA
jgi:hypothetical protein